MSNYFDFAPYQPKGLLHTPPLRYKHLKLMNFFVGTIVQAMELFYIEKKYNLFDPHVGDTLCQIRAVQLLEFYQYDVNSVTDYIESLKDVLKKIDSLIPIYEKFLYTRRRKAIKGEQDHTTLENFINDNKLDFNIPKNIEIISKIYLLSKYKIHPVGQAPKLNYEVLVNTLDISKDFCYRLVKYWQRSLSEYSCDYIEALSQSKQSVINNFKRYDDDNRAVLPCYVVMKMIFSELEKKQYPILLIVRNPDNSEIKPLVVNYFFTKDNKKEISFSNYIPMNKPHFTIWGVSKYITKDSPSERLKLLKMLDSFGMDNILLSSVANHPQFSGKKLSYYNDNPYKLLLDEGKALNSELKYFIHEVNQSYNYSKKLAEKFNCNMFDNTFIYAEHMLLSNLQEQLRLFNIDEYYINNQMLPIKEPQKKYSIYSPANLIYANLAEVI